MDIHAPSGREEPLLERAVPPLRTHYLAIEQRETIGSVGSILPTVGPIPLARGAIGLYIEGILANLKLLLHKELLQYKNKTAYVICAVCPLPLKC